MIYFFPSDMHRAKIRPTTAAILHALAAEVQLAALHELGGQERVFHQGPQTAIAQKRPQLERADEFQLPQAAVAADVVEERLLEEERPLPGLRHDAALEGDLPQGIHHAGTIDRFRAAGRTGHARHAFPDRLGAHRLLGLAELHEANQPVRQDVHGIGHRAAGRALAALIAIAQVRAGEVFDAEIVG